jgi:hypothetical protein
MSEPTKDDLRRRIAERLGYRIEQISFSSGSSGEPDSSPWILKSPNGKQIVQMYDLSAILMQLPNWPDDLNAAARDLLRDMPNHLLIWHDYYEMWAIQEVVFEDNQRDFETRVVDDEPAMAICLAWLAMHEEAENE